MEVLRTPDERFENLDRFPFPPHYVTVPDGEGGTLRMHHVDEGEGPFVVLLHGEPTWSYLYRGMIPPLVEAGFRCVAPDLIGFGRSDKPSRQEDHTYQRHVDWMKAALFDALDLAGITFFGQDWGGLIGMRLVADAPDRYTRVVLSNTGLPTGDQQMPAAFRAWREHSRSAPSFEIGRIVDGGTLRALTPGERVAYDAPFPDEGYKAGPRVFPSLVPDTPDHPAAEANRAAWRALRTFDRPLLCAWSDSDPITAGADRPFRKLVPGARDASHTTIEGAGHFVQEDKGTELAALIIRFSGL